MRVLALLLALPLAACHTAPPASHWKPDASLLTLCDEKGPLLTGPSGKEVVVWGVAMRQELETCAKRHKRLVEAIPKEK